MPKAPRREALVARYWLPDPLPPPAEPVLAAPAPGMAPVPAPAPVRAAPAQAPAPIRMTKRLVAGGGTEPFRPSEAFQGADLLGHRRSSRVLRDLKGVLRDEVMDSRIPDHLRVGSPAAAPAR